MVARITTTQRSFFVFVVFLSGQKARLAHAWLACLLLDVGRAARSCGWDQGGFVQGPATCRVAGRHATSAVLLPPHPAPATPCLSLTFVCTRPLPTPSCPPRMHDLAPQVIRFVILLNGVIPISLYVTLEIVKLLQCKMLLDCDRGMYHAETDTPFSCRTTSLNEDLGQVREGRTGRGGRGVFVYFGGEQYHIRVPVCVGTVVWVGGGCGGVAAATPARQVGRWCVRCCFPLLCT